MVEYLKALLSNKEDASSKRLMGIISGIAGLVMAALGVSSGTLSIVFAYSAGCFGVSALQKFIERPLGKQPPTPPPTQKPKDTDK